MKKKPFSAWAVRCKDGKTHSRIAPTKSVARKFVVWLEAFTCGPHKLVKLVEVTK